MVEPAGEPKDLDGKEIAAEGERLVASRLAAVVV